MMFVKDLERKIKDFCPFKYACKSDFVGFQFACSPKKRIQKILITLDCDWEAIKKATEKNIDLIITHHPFLWPTKRKALRNEDKRKKIEFLKKNKICVFSMHTNYDNFFLGNDLANIYFLNEIKNVESKVDLASIFVLKKEKKFEEIIAQVRKKNKKWIEYFGDFEKKIRRVAIVPGAGGGLIKDLSDKKVDLIITGEIKWNNWLEIKERQQSILVLGHQMEDNFVFMLEKRLKDLFQKDNIKIEIQTHTTKLISKKYD